MLNLSKNKLITAESQPDTQKAVSVHGGSFQCVSSKQEREREV